MPRFIDFFNVQFKKRSLVKTPAFTKSLNTIRLMEEDEEAITIANQLKRVGPGKKDWLDDSLMKGIQSELNNFVLKMAKGMGDSQKAASRKANDIPSRGKILGKRVRALSIAANDKPESKRVRS